MFAIGLPTERLFEQAAFSLSSPLFIRLVVVDFLIDVHDCFPKHTAHFLQT